jgi:hypothetical protein
LSEYSARYSIFVELLIFITNERAPPTRVKKTVKYDDLTYKKLPRTFEPEIPHASQCKLELLKLKRALFSLVPNQKNRASGGTVKSA